jgi:hypothetical protein
MEYDTTKEHGLATFCCCGDNAEHDPGAMCLHCRIVSAVVRLEDDLADKPSVELGEIFG